MQRSSLCAHDNEVNFVANLGLLQVLVQLATLLLAELGERRVADGPVTGGIVLRLGVANEYKFWGHG